MAQVAPNSINLFDLPIPQLQAIRQQLEEEIQVLTDSFAKLRSAHVKFGDCIDSVDKLKGTEKSILVPLTNSLYVPGTLSSGNKVLVDIGTGYYMEKVLTI
jgi:prefoldin alpha subunit